ncbi:MAG: winged helix-turn-helix domain-containing protein [Steroidobacteraceae bacterium]
MRGGGGSGVRARRDFQGLEQRRTQAARLFGAGERMATVARTLQVSRQSVSRWFAQWNRGGTTALRGAGRAGRAPRLHAHQLRQVERALRTGARANGFNTDLWTLPRVAQVIERVTGVSYHAGHVWRVMRAMGWTLQRPARRARERNEEAIRQWVADRWPAVKKKPAASTPGLPSKTKAGSPSGRRSVALGPPAAKRHS